jgi:hypothetical protein
VVIPDTVALDYLVIPDTQVVESPVIQDTVVSAVTADLVALVDIVATVV